jgi:hypothetical protein
VLRARSHVRSRSAHQSVQVPYNYFNNSQISGPQPCIQPSSWAGLCFATRFRTPNFVPKIHTFWTGRSNYINGLLNSYIVFQVMFWLPDNAVYGIFVVGVWRGAVIAEGGQERSGEDRVQAGQTEAVQEPNTSGFAACAARGTTEGPQAPAIWHMAVRSYLLILAPFSNCFNREYYSTRQSHYNCCIHTWLQNISFTYFALCIVT